MKNCKTIAKYAEQGIIKSATQVCPFSGRDKYYVTLIGGETFQTSMNGFFEATKVLGNRNESSSWNCVSVSYSA